MSWSESRAGGGERVGNLRVTSRQHFPACDEVEQFHAAAARCLLDISTTVSSIGYKKM